MNKAFALVIAVSAMVCVALPCLGDSGGVEVPASGSIKILGMPAQTVAASNWTTGVTYSQGQYVQAGGSIYFALVPGTATTTMPAGYGDQPDGDMVWRRCLSHDRKALSIGNESGASKVYLSLRALGTNRTGIVLAPGAVLNLSGASIEQCEVHAISELGSTNRVVTEEW